MPSINNNSAHWTVERYSKNGYRDDYNCQTSELQLKSHSSYNILPKHKISVSQEGLKFIQTYTKLINILNAQEK